MSQQRIDAFRIFVSEHGWKITDEKQIDYATQVALQTPSGRVTVNFYTSGKVVVGGKSSSDREAVQVWANQGLFSQSASTDKQSRSTTYFVLPNRISEVWREIGTNLPGRVTERVPTGSGQLAGAEVWDGNDRVTLTQYRSGTLMVQGANCILFDLVCQKLDERLRQSVEQRATRLLLSEPARTAAESYIKKPEAENEAADWLNRQLSSEAQAFLHPNDLLTLLSGVAVKLALSKVGEDLPDYSVIVAGFGKAFEGFVIKLAEYFQFVNLTDLEQRADAIQIGNWLDEIERRLPDAKRYSAELSALESAWQCRNKAMHSDRFHAYSLLRTPEQAEQEILTILRAMNRVHAVFVAGGVQLKPAKRDDGQISQQAQVPKTDQKFQNVDRQALYDRLRADNFDVKMLNTSKKNEWELITKTLRVLAPREQAGLVIVAGTDATGFCRQYHELLVQYNPPEKPAEKQVSVYIGADESGKGDVFGPLVVAAVAVDERQAVMLANAGVRDSKDLSDVAIKAIAKFVRESCPHLVTTLMPEQYNVLYRTHGTNLNRLLAWAHADNIRQLSATVKAEYALIDQFADEAVMRGAMSDAGCTVVLKQYPRAESDIAVAAASILARDAFISAIARLQQVHHVNLPLGASSPKVRETAEAVYKLWGSDVLAKLAKMHFSTVNNLQ